MERNQACIVCVMKRKKIPLFRSKLAILVRSKRISLTDGVRRVLKLMSNSYFVAHSQFQTRVNGSDHVQKMVNLVSMSTVPIFHSNYSKIQLKSVYTNSGIHLFEKVLEGVFYNFFFFSGRMALLITLFLVLINIFNNITTNSPKAEGLTAIEIWMLACILFVFGERFVNNIGCRRIHIIISFFQ